jgi:hypothetical protein
MRAESEQAFRNAGSASGGLEPRAWEDIKLAVVQRGLGSDHRGSPQRCSVWAPPRERTCGARCLAPLRLLWSTTSNGG